MTNYEQPTQGRWLPISSRLLRVAAFAVCLIACIVFGALWARSYYWNDTVYRHHAGGYWHLRSWQGSLEYISMTSTVPNANYSFGLTSTSTKEWEATISAYGGQGTNGPEAWGFGWGGLHRRMTRVVAPHWFLTAITGILAFALKPKPRRRISLGEVLVIMTVAAITVAAFASLHRKLFVG